MATIVKTAKPAGMRIATSFGMVAAAIAKGMVACLPLYPAVRLNLEAAKGAGETWAIVAIGFVICAALFIENALHAVNERRFASSAAFLMLGLFFVALNVMNALGNAAGHSDHSRDEKRSRMDAAASLSSQRSQLSKAREEQATIAGETAVEALDADIQAKKSTDARRWQASDGCDLDKIRGEAVRTFCADIAALQKKRAAATKRDEIDGKLAKLAEEAKGVADAPSSLDPYADAMAEGLAALGLHVQDKAAITTARNWAKACGVELMAAFGPGAILLLLGRFRRPLVEEKAPRQAPKGTGKDEKLPQANATPAATSAPVKPLPAALDGSGPQLHS